MSVLVAGARRVLLGTAFPTISLSNSIVNSTASIGTVIGTLGINGNVIGTPSFSLLDDAGGLFQIVADELQVAGALSVQDYTIVVSVSGVTPAPNSRSITIHSIAVGTGTPIGLLLILTN